MKELFINRNISIKSLKQTTKVITFIVTNPKATNIGKNVKKVHGKMPLEYLMMAVSHFIENNWKYFQRYLFKTLC